MLTYMTNPNLIAFKYVMVLYVIHIICMIPQEKKGH